LGEFILIEGSSASGGLVVDALDRFQAGLQAWFCDHVDRMTKQVLEVYEQRGQVEQAPARLEVDQEIDVAGGVGIPTRDRPEDADIAGAMASGDGQDLLAYAGEIVD
jgi:hypothetical protein